MIRLAFVILLFSTAIEISAQKPAQPKLLNLLPSECDEEPNPFEYRNKVISKTFNKDTAEIEIGIVANCCVDFEPEVKRKGEQINLIYKETGDPCRCICCYQLVYEIKGLPYEKYTFLLNGQKILDEEKSSIMNRFKKSHEVIDGDTVNFVDANGIEHGKHIIFNGLNQVIRQGTYENGVFSGIAWTYYYKTGKKKIEWYVQKDKCTKIMEYYDNEASAVKAEIGLNDCFVKHGKAREYDENGTVSKILFYHNDILLKESKPEGENSKQK